MIKIENVEVFGWESAIRGMRNPMNSWNKSDSSFSDCNQCSFMIDGHEYKNKGECFLVNGETPCGIIGENDLQLMKKLAKAGSDHAKFLRMINVTFDVTAPLYFFKEFDTYKVGTVANSCSTMHKIHDKEFTLYDFSYEHLLDAFKDYLMANIKILNWNRERFIETKDKKYWWQMIQLLPTSYNQRRTVQLNYQVLLNMYHARKNHKLDEWREFCKWIEGLPYFKEICLTDCVEKLHHNSNCETETFKRGM